MIFRLGTSTFCPRSLCTPSNPFFQHFVVAIIDEVTCNKMIARSPRIVGTSEVGQNL